MGVREFMTVIMKQGCARSKNATGFPSKQLTCDGDRLASNSQECLANQGGFIEYQLPET